MKLKCSIIRVSPHDAEVKGTLISISQGFGAVWIGNRVHEYPLSRILIEEKVKLPELLEDTEVEPSISADKVEEAIKIEKTKETITQLNSKLKGTK